MVPLQSLETLPFLALLDAIHPSGAAQRIHFAGNPNGATGAVAPADVVLLAPGLHQYRDRGVLGDLLPDALAPMSDGAVLFLIAPRATRILIARRLRKAGLTQGTPVVHLRSGAARYDVPLTSNCLQFALRTWPQSWRWRWVLLLLQALPMLRVVLAAVLPSVGISFYRAGTVPFAWLLSRLPKNADGQAIVATSWRGPHSPYLVFGLTNDASLPTVVAKRSPRSSAATTVQEAAMLNEVAPGAARAGVVVPSLIALKEGNKLVSLIETVVPGAPASRILAEDADRFPQVIEQVCAWLEAWHRQSARQVTLDPELLEALILSPARSLACLLPDGARYLTRLSTAAFGLVGQKVTMVGTHNDLTMSNVLWNEGRLSGVVDWEAARPLGFPLADFWYAACDAAMASGRTDRPSAFRSCFADDGQHRSLIGPMQKRLQAAVGGPAGWIELSFRACWLHHAANEARQSLVNDCRPFLAVASEAMSLQAVLDPG